MGVKRGGRKHQGKVDSALTSQHISEPNRKCAADNDPYGAGEQSGKCAKPDAHSAAANARAHAVKAEPPCTQPPPLTSLMHPPPTPLPLPPRTQPAPLMPMPLPSPALCYGSDPIFLFSNDRHLGGMSPQVVPCLLYYYGLILS